MSSNHDVLPDAELPMKGARGPQRLKSVRDLPQLQLENAQPQAKAVRDGGGNDPYNTSGSFDRTKNWARIGKR
jgi:hypothetical protein